VLAAPIPEQEVRCRVERSRRIDHMQQHSGQHVLSQAFFELFSLPTLSFHLGQAACTIDLPAESLTREQAVRAEDLANRVVHDNRPVSIRYLDKDELQEAGLRKTSERTGEIRVIDIAGYDRSACGGTHVRTTGEIGPVLITRLERVKRQTRVEFICGNRVLRFAREANQTLETISQIVSVPPLDAANGVRTVWNRLEQARKHIEDLEEKLIRYEANAFPVENGAAVASFQGRGIETLRQLAVRVCERPSIVAVLADESDQLRLVVARSADLTIDASAVIKKVIERFGGRGGGRPNLAQGGGMTASAEAVLQYASGLCREQH
jgi:alanyl-tRNA synthetase